MNNRQLLAGLGLIVVLAASWFFFTNFSFEPKTDRGFGADGRLAKSTPGLASGDWLLVYDEIGFPSISVPLSFDANSMCDLGGATSICKTTALQEGDRVHVEGIYIGSGVHVEKLTFLKPNERGVPVSLYYYDPEKDKDSSGGYITCSSEGLVPVARVLPATQTPLKDAIQLLLQGSISDEEKAAGVTSEFPLLGVRLEKAAIENGVATLTFSDPGSKTSGGSCRVSILRAQVESTAKQFPGIKEVRFAPQEVFQP